jgi:LCP family protein required for cell wall assembly
MGTIATRVAVAGVATAVLGGTAMAWTTATSFNSGFTRSSAIGADAPHSLGGDLNVLLIGLDSRKDLNGNDLPKAILSQLHAGDGEEGGYNANSIILVHIPADMQHIVAFSIPRDDWVAMRDVPGYTHEKIKESYGLKMAAVQDQLVNQGMSSTEAYQKAREAGRASIVQTVRDLTGVPIDRFAEVSLFGFYDIAKVLGGVDVCLNHPVRDLFYSGANFPAGPQHLNASQALSFVRQRHNLDNGDLDRTHRQQAFITSVAKQLKESGTLGNIGKLSALMDVAHRDIVLSDNWDLIDFAQQMGKASKITVEFRTLPVLRYDTVNGQDVNMVDPAAIGRTVREAFGMQQAAPTAPSTQPTSTVDVLNGGGEPGLATKVSDALTAKGFKAGTVGNAGVYDGTNTSLSYGSGAETDAKQLAAMLGGNITPSASDNVAPGHVKLVLGGDFTLPDGLSAPAPQAAAGTTGGPSASTSASPASASDGGPDSGNPVATTIGDKIPCVN